MFNDSFNKALATAHYKGNFIEMAYNFYRLKEGETVEPIQDDFYERERRCFQYVPMLIEQMVKRQVCDKADFDRCHEEEGQGSSYKLYDENNPPKSETCSLKYLQEKLKSPMMKFRSPDLCDCLANDQIQRQDGKSGRNYSSSANSQGSINQHGSYPSPSSYSNAPHPRYQCGQMHYNNSSNIATSSDDRRPLQRLGSAGLFVMDGREEYIDGICEFKKNRNYREFQINLNNSGKRKEEGSDCRKEDRKYLHPPRPRGGKRPSYGTDFYWSRGYYGEDPGNDNCDMGKANKYSPEVKVVLLRKRLKNFKTVVGRAIEQLDEIGRRVKCCGCKCCC